MPRMELAPVDAAIAMDADGDFVIVWTSFERGGISGFENSGIYARRYSGTGDGGG